MYRSLYFKIILMFVVFMVTVMAVVGTVLLNSVFTYYSDEFSDQVGEYLSADTQLRQRLTDLLGTENCVNDQKTMLNAYGTLLGIDEYRNFYILDKDGNCLASSSSEDRIKTEPTPNLVSAMNGKDGIEQVPLSEYADYAVYLRSGDDECIIYVRDSQEEMRTLSWRLFTIILQSVLFGLFIAVLLSFFLAKAITQPIRNLTVGARLVAAGEFTNKLSVESKDEIGTLTSTFNYMNSKLKNTLNEVDGERRKLKTIFSYLKDGVIAFSEEGRIIQINQTAVDLIGIKYNKNFSFTDLVNMLDVEFSKAYETTEGEEKSYVIRDVRLGDKAIDINIGDLKYIAKNETRTGAIVVIHDITSRYELDKARREFVANVSHELRTPLTVIKGATETLLNYPDMDEQMRESFLNSSIEESNRMLNIVKDLLTLSRLDDKRTKWNITEFDIVSSCAHLCDMLTVTAQEKNQTIAFHAPIDREILVRGDKERIEQVLINIISNAVKYTDDGGKIDVFAVRSGDSVTINVKDNGFGIPEEDLPRIFDRFYRVEKSRTYETGGTGLGLAIAKEITEAHGGKISIKSKLGVGSDVEIVLPLKTKLESA